MAITPQFGSTNDVTDLDIGQKGSPRHTAGTAMWIGRVLVGPDEVADAIVKLPEQNVVYRSVQGFAGRPVRWRGRLKVDDDATLEAIEDELNEKRHGGITGPNFDELHATKLTNAHERVLSERAVMEEWRFVGPVLRITGGSSFTLTVELEIKFMCLA